MSSQICCKCMGNVITLSECICSVQRVLQSDFRKDTILGQSELNVTPEAVQLVAGLNSELLPQKSKQRYIGQFFLTKTVLLIGVCGACLRKELYTLKMENVKRRYYIDN
ncbi:hypothetical protein MTP99_001662 [Tenebrio molitor]|nr:hypothetical protein MTP99_001662 [Tenebrio molitor]